MPCGGGAYLLLREYTNISDPLSQVFTILLIVAIRTLAVKYHWEMPKFYLNEKSRSNPEKNSPDL